jgi:hypothetical protein
MRDACLEQGDIHATVAAFKEATIRHPEAKEGCFDSPHPLHGGFL